MKNNDFIKMVQDDITRCDGALQNNEKLSDLQSELIGKYSKVSANFPSIEQNPLLQKHHPKTYRENVQKIVGFLKAYQLNDCEDYRFGETKNGVNSGINVTVNSTNNNTNVNENFLELQVFCEAREKLEEMQSLPDKEIDEALAKIDELENIIKSNERRSKKWSKARGILLWLADKGVDVGIAFLPLLLQI